MLEQISLLNEFRESGYEGAVLTTYNLHLPFLEEVVVRRLHANGCRHIVVLADHDQLIAALQAAYPRQAGRDYLLLPVRGPQAFHPKVILLAGRTKGFLAVGSHNLTFAGYGHNREVTSVFRFGGKAGDGTAAHFQQAWQTLQGWFESAAIGKHRGAAELARQLSRMAPWLDESAPVPSPDARLCFGDPRSATLYSQVWSRIAAPTRQLTIAGAFFDRKTAFLRKLLEDLRPSRTVVLVDPATTDIPAGAARIAGCEFRKADALGVSSSGYLHAKLVHVLDNEGRHHLVTGSANPSAPAWLNTGAEANCEAVVVLSGAAAEAASEALGLEVARQREPLSDTDWQTIAAQPQRASDSPGRWDVSIAVRVDDGAFEVETPGPASVYSVRLADDHGVELAAHVAQEQIGPSRLRLLIADYGGGAALHLYRDDRLVRVAFIHDLGALSDHARTGMQRRFRASLASLDTDAPALNELFKCIEDVLDLSKDEGTSRPMVRPAGSEPAPGEAPTSLAVSISGLSRKHRHGRLTAGTDLGYIIDILIRSLSQELSSGIERVDDLGRTEEELIGADDEVDGKAQKTDANAARLLKLCHRKVRRLVNRCADLLAALVNGKPARRVVPRITAALALLRQLRAHDKSIWWVNVARGESAVPLPELQRLMTSVVKNLMGAPISGRPGEEPDAELMTSEEYARVRGLVFWLGAITGVNWSGKAAFNESRKETNLRYQQNARFLSLSEMLGDDPMSLEEAERAIGTTNAQIGAVLQKAIDLHQRLAAARASVTGSSTGTAARAGDIAFHPEMPELGFRIVTAADADHVTLTDSDGSRSKAFQAHRLRCIPSAELESRN